MYNTIQLLQQHSILFLTIVGIISLLVGSFLNVVIVRLPIMLENADKKECMSILSIPNTESEQANKTFNLFVPRSHCPKCNYKIKLWENIPLLSFILLKGKCRSCNQAISLEYPAVEALTAIISIIIAWKFGVGIKTIKYPNIY